MESEQFDRATRIWASGTSRRSLLVLLTGTGMSLATLTTGEARKKRRGKNKKKKRRQQGPASPPGSPPASPPAGGCAAGTRLCNGACIPDQNCCDGLECTVALQICADSGRCECPPARPVICDNVCQRPCASNESRKPDCNCCTANGGFTLDPSTCCSGVARSDGQCVGLASGSPCTFGAPCISLNCVQGFCSSCTVGANSCATGATCGVGGRCLQAVDGTTRCGVPLMSFDCGLCTRDLDCDQGQGLGYFCAQNTGPFCPCAGLTFCARP